MKPSRWAKPATMARPAKADPDVIRLQDRYLLTYGRARLLKAFSYGLALRHDLLAYLLGDDGAPIRCMGDAFEGIRRRVPRFRPRAIGHTDALYVLEDHGLIAEIRAAMEGTDMSVNVGRGGVSANNFPAFCGAESSDMKIPDPKTFQPLVDRRLSFYSNRKPDRHPIQMGMIGHQRLRQSNFSCSPALVESEAPTGNSPVHNVLTGQSYQSSFRRRVRPYRQEIGRMNCPTPDKRGCLFLRNFHSPCAADRSIAS